MGETRQDDTRTELSRPGEPGLTTRMVEKGIQQQQCRLSSHVIYRIQRDLSTIPGVTHGAYVGAVVEMMCVVIDEIWRLLCVSLI